MNESVFLAILLSTLAGLSTGLGGLLVFWTHHTNTRFLAVSLGFSAGMMLYISFVDLLGAARDVLFPVWGPRSGSLVMTGAFFGGIVLVMLIDRFVPSYENPHEMHRIEEAHSPRAHPAKLARVGILMTTVIAVHNFPEGMTTFMSGLNGLKLGLPIAVAIAIHNIPEGMAAAIPMYYATKSRSKALAFSVATGLIEPLGALVAFAFLGPFLTPAVFGVVFAAMAGVMVFISLDQLLPTAEKYGEHHLAIYGLVAGMAVMAGSLLLFL